MWALAFLSTLSLRRATGALLGVVLIQQVFLSTLSLRRATPGPDGCTVQPAFLSTLSLRRATGIPVIFLGNDSNFYPRSPCGERPYVLPVPRPPQIFLSTLSLRRATLPWCSCRCQSAFLSTLSLRRATLTTVLHWYHISNFYPRSPCGERHRSAIENQYSAEISIHALLAESDATPRSRKTPLLSYFYPRSPCGERLFDTRWPYTNFHISIHALLAESDAVLELSARDDYISIHALLAESDSLTPNILLVWAISIHALLAESDASKSQTTMYTLHFYPRSPCGERRYAY